MGTPRASASSRHSRISLLNNPIAKPALKVRGRTNLGNLSAVALLRPVPALMTSRICWASSPAFTPITRASGEIALRLQAFRNAPGVCRAGCGHVDKNLHSLAVGNAVRSERCGLHDLRRWQAGQHDVTGRTHRRRRIHGQSTHFRQRPHGRIARVVDRKLVTSLDQTACHAATHPAYTNKTYILSH